MSAGAFENAFYRLSEENGGYVVRCRVQPETRTATINATPNAGEAGPANAPGSATISQGRRTAGINMRYVSLKWTGTKPTGYDGATVRIPVLSPAIFAEWTLGATGTYLGQPVEVVGRQPETVK